MVSGRLVHLYLILVSNFTMQSSKLLEETTKKLDEQTKNRLTGLAEKLNQKLMSNSNTAASVGGSKFLKFRDQERKMLEFVPNLTEETMVTYPSNPNEPVHRIKFYVYELDEDTEDRKNPEAATEPLEWTASETTARDVLRFLTKSILIMTITRIGSDIKSTKYLVDPKI